MNCLKKQLPCAVALLVFFLASYAAQHPGYAYYPGYGYYKLHTSLDTWGNAWAKCRLEGGHLAVINSDEEARILSSLFSQVSITAKYCIIGFHDMFKEGHHVTIFGNSLNETGYNKWSSGQPNNAGGYQHCGAISREGLLNDRPCNRSLPFICEIELPSE